jgi:hypothetical protein
VRQQLTLEVVSALERYLGRPTYSGIGRADL